MQGERDYTKLKGDTGPLVYPAGFVYLFAWLKAATGGSVQAAQVRAVWSHGAVHPGAHVCCWAGCCAASSQLCPLAQTERCLLMHAFHLSPLQYIFTGLYLATQAAVMALYIRAASLPPWSLALLAASRRLHSLYLLRLFNDCWAMLAAYLATLALQVGGWVGQAGLWPVTALTAGRCPRFPDNASAFPA